MHTKKGVPDGRTRTVRQLGICRKCFFQNDDSLALITGNRPACPADRGESKKGQTMATEEEIKRILDSEPEAKIEIHFRKEGMGLNFGNATPSQIIMAAVTLLNKGIDHEETDWFVRVMAAVNEIDKKVNDNGKK